MAWENTTISVGEPSGSALLAVTLSAASAFTITVAYATSNGSATAGSDYTSTSGTLTFAPGVSTNTVSVPILNDPTQESSETVLVTLSSPTNASLAVPNTPVTLTIIDDESPPTAPEELYSYDALGNITFKTGVGSYSYSAAHPHAVTTAGPFGFGYDANGNMTTVGGQFTTWDAENRPSSIQRVSGSETYAYDADGERINRTAGFTTTVFLGGLWQEDVASGAVGVTRVLYGFNGATVAQRTHVTSPASASVIYLHGDHLGSVSVVSSWNGSAATLLSSQRFDPWGKVLPGGNVTQTHTNYTGQELDTTGLLYYHARYYDPHLGRFLSADTIVPGSASGSMDGVALKGLTVDFHEPDFVSGLNGENRQAFWFQLSDDERQQVGSPWGPMNPQALNRYSYVQNNPLLWTDPTGHCPWCRLLGPIFSAVSKYVGRFGNWAGSQLNRFGQWIGGLFRSVPAAGSAANAAIQTVSRIEVAGPKLDYLLRLDTGKAKGFQQLGFSLSNSDALRKTLESAAKQVDLSSGVAAQYGTKFEKVIEIVGPNGVAGRITTVWQIDHGSDVLRFITAIPEPFR